MEQITEMMNDTTIQETDDTRDDYLPTDDEEEVEEIEEEEEDIAEEEAEEAEEEAEDTAETTTEADTDDGAGENILADAKFKWKLSRKDWTTTIFKGKKMQERTDILKVYGFIQNEMGITYQGNTRYEGMPKELKTELDLMKAYRELYNETEEVFSVAHTLPRHKWGRTIPAGYLSLSVQHRPTRHALCEGIYRDKDMANMHPQLIAEITRQHNIRLEKLEKYNAQYKAYRAKIAEHHGLDIRNPDHKNIAKQLPIRLVYGGSYDQWIKDNNILVNIRNKMPLFVKIEEELAGVREIVFRENQDIYKDAMKQDPRKWKTIHEAKRGVMSLWCQTIERRLMEDSVMHLVDTRQFKLEDIVPCQDGLMILKDLNYPEIEAELQAIILENYGIKVVWEDKAFDEAIDIPLYEGTLKSAEKWFDEVTPKPMAERLKAMMGKKILFDATNDKLYVFYSERWYDESEYPKKAHNLRKIISEDLYTHTIIEMESSVNLKAEQKKSLRSIIRSVTSKAGQYGDIITQLISVAHRCTDRQFDCNPLLLGFENGKINLVTGEFSEYQHDDYITLTTLYNYRRPSYEGDDEQSVKDRDMRDTLIRLFGEIQPDEARQTLLIQILASGLDGNNYQAMWYFNGSGGNGKGLIGRLMVNMLGKNFVLSPKQTLLTDDSASKGASPDIADLLHKRYIVFKEMGGTNHLPALRKLTGGDQLRGRQLYGNNIEINVEATICGEFNNMPDYDQAPQDADYRRGRDIKFDNKWTSDPTKIGKTIDEIFYREANPYYESAKFINESRDVFLDMLLGCYRVSYDEDIQRINFQIPDSVWRSSKTLIDGTNKFRIWFDKSFEVSPSRAEDVLIKRKVFSDEKNKEITVKDYPSRLQVGELWEVISTSREYLTGARNKAREFERNWGKKEFFRWAETSLNAKKDSKYAYVLGYKLADTAEITWVRDASDSIVSYHLEEDNDDEGEEDLA